jgi:hypothetical protein
MCVYKLLSCICACKIFNLSEKVSTNHIDNGNTQEKKVLHPRTVSLLPHYYHVLKFKSSTSQYVKHLFIKETAKIVFLQTFFFYIFYLHVPGKY